MSKRGQISSETFVYILAVVIVGITMFMGYKYISAQKSTGSTAEVLNLHNQMASDFRSVGNYYGSAKKFSYDAPKGLQSVCFAGLNKKEKILSTKLIDFYPLVKDILKSNSPGNIFFAGSSVKDSLQINNIVIGQYPYFYCVSPKNGMIDFEASSLGGGNSMIAADLFPSAKINNNEDVLLKSADGVVELNVLRNIRSNSDRISLRMIEPIPNLKKAPASDIYQFQPSGTIFTRPIELKFKYNPLLLGECPTIINFYHFNDGGSRKEAVPAKSIDCAGKYAYFDIKSFSHGYIAVSIPSEIQDLAELNADVVALGREYRIGDAKRKMQVLSDLRQFINARKVRMDALIESNPQEFIDNALSENQRAQLPTEVQNDIEKETTLITTADVLHVDDFKNHENSKYEYYVRSGNNRLKLHLAGEFEPFISNTKIRVKGFVLGNKMVASASQETFQILEQAPAQETVGEQKVAVFLVDFLDSGTRPYTKEDVKKIIFEGNVNKFFKEASYDKMYLSGDVFDWYKLQREGMANGVCQFPAVGDSLSEELEKIVNANNVDLSKYRGIILIPNQNQDCIGGGFGTLGKWNVMINNKKYPVSISWDGGIKSFKSEDVKAGMLETNFEHIISHEFGHNLGAWHSNAWYCGEQVFYGYCQHYEYGNRFDTMGVGYYSAHFNAYYKDLFNWIDQSSKIVIDKSGRYSLQDLESKSGYKTAIINAKNYKNALFYLENRKGLGFDSKLNEPDLISNQNGLFVNNVVTNGEVMARLLDMTPGIPSDNTWQQVTLNQNQIYEDKKHGFTIGPIISANDSGVVFDVKIDDTQKNPIIRVDPTYLFAKLNRGETAKFLFDIKNEGAANLQWSVSSDSEWVSFGQPDYGTVEPNNAATLSAKIDSSMIKSTNPVNTKDYYTSNIIINSNDETVKIPVGVSLIGPAIPDNVRINPKELSFYQFENGEPELQKLAIYNDGSGDIKWFSRTSVLPINPTPVNWIDASTDSRDQSGTIKPKGSEILNVRIKKDGLVDGFYYGAVYISIDEISHKIPVKMQFIQGFDVRPARFYFHGILNGNNPENQSIHLINTGKENLNWRLNANDAWLKVRTNAERDKLSGTITPSGISPTINVSADITGLGPDAYKSLINIYFSHGSGSISAERKIEIPVVLNITSKQSRRKASEELCPFKIGACSQFTDKCVQPCEDRSGKNEYFCLDIGGSWKWRTREEIASGGKCTKTCSNGRCENRLPCTKFEWPFGCRDARAAGAEPRGFAGSCYAVDEKFHFDYEAICSDGTVYQEIGECENAGKISAKCRN